MAASTDPVKLYYFAMSPPSRAVHYFAVASGIPIDLDIVDLLDGAQRRPPYSELLPFGKVPTLDDHGFVLAESHAILRYLHQKYHTSLFSSDAQVNGRIEEALEFITNSVYSAVSQIVVNRVFAPFLGREKDEAAAVEGEAKLRSAFTKIERHFFKESEHHLVGTTLSAADIVLVTWLQNLRFARVQYAEFTRLSAFETHLKGTESYQQAHAQFEEMFAKVMPTLNK